MPVDPDLHTHAHAHTHPNLEKQVIGRMSNLILPGACVCAGKYRGFR